MIKHFRYQHVLHIYSRITISWCTKTLQRFKNIRRFFKEGFVSPKPCLTENISLQFFEHHKTKCQHLWEGKTDLPYFKGSVLGVFCVCACKDLQSLQNFKPPSVFLGHFSHRHHVGRPNQTLGTSVTRLGQRERSNSP